MTDSSSYSSSKQGTYSTLGLHPYFDMKSCTANANADTTTANMGLSCYTRESDNECTSLVPHSPKLPSMNVFTSAGFIHCPAVLECSSFEVDPSTCVAKASGKSTKLYGERFISLIEKQLAESVIQPPFDIIGDNLDILKSTSSMTKENQRKSLHWFLLVGLQRRVLGPDMTDEKPTHDILSLPNQSFLPSAEEVKLLERNMNHHILKVITKHVECLKPFAHCVPTHICHHFIEQTSKQSSHFILDLLDKNEDVHDDIISILEHIHQSI